MLEKLKIIWSNIWFFLLLKEKGMQPESTFITGWQLKDDLALLSATRSYLGPGGG